MVKEQLESKQILVRTVGKDPKNLLRGKKRQDRTVYFGPINTIDWCYSNREKTDDKQEEMIHLHRAYFLIEKVLCVCRVNCIDILYTTHFSKIITLFGAYVITSIVDTELIALITSIRGVNVEIIS